MDNQVFYKLVEETRLQCRFARFAFQNIRSGANSLDAENVFFYVDAFLSHANNISRLLWPERETSKARGDRLRAELNISDDSPLRLREIQEQLDHFDERVEDWLEPMENRNSMDMNLMPQGTMADYTPDKFNRSLDPNTFQYSLRGSSCELRRVLDEISRLETALQMWFRTHNPW